MRGATHNSTTKQKSSSVTHQPGFLLIALYTLIHCTKSEDYTICIDEPENFLALPEIQPWLVELYDLCSDGQLQALLISHHPELINYLLASPIGYWFERQTNTPVRVKRIGNETSDNSGLPVSELITPDKNVIVLDDQYTTGATADAITSKLREKGAKNILFIALFHLVTSVNSSKLCPRCLANGLNKQLQIKINRTTGEKFYSCVLPKYRGDGCGYTENI